MDQDKIGPKKLTISEYKKRQPEYRRLLKVEDKITTVPKIGFPAIRKIINDINTEKNLKEHTDETFCEDTPNNFRDIDSTTIAVTKDLTEDKNTPIVESNKTGKNKGKRGGIIKRIRSESKKLRQQIELLKVGTPEYAKVQETHLLLNIELKTIRELRKLKEDA